MTRAEKVTISLPAPLLAFLSDYQARQHLSRSEVIQQAIRTLQEADLARAYRDAGAEMLADPLFDLDSGHGLERE